MKNGPYELILAPPDYPGTLYRGMYAYEHHIVYWQHTGHVLESGEEIHHKNGNRRDNDFDNLELITGYDHRSLHGRQQGKNMVRLKCPVCDIIFVKEKRQTHLQHPGSTFTFCSQECSRRFRTIIKRSEEGIKQQLIRENVIEEFKCWDVP